MLQRLESRADLLTGSAAKLRDASDARWLLVRHAETLPTTDGGTFEWEFCNPNLLMAMMINDSPALQEVYAKVADKMRRNWPQRPRRKRKRKLNDNVKPNNRRG